MKIVYLVLNPENGWNNVVGVFRKLKGAVEYCGGVYEDGKEPHEYEFKNEDGTYVIVDRELE
jgi:hypothetical protein